MRKATAATLLASPNLTNKIVTTKAKANGDTTYLGGVIAGWIWGFYAGVVVVVLVSVTQRSKSWRD